MVGNLTLDADVPQRPPLGWLSGPLQDSELVMASDTSKQDEAGQGEAAEKEYLGGNPVKEMFLLALLYLPLGFFLWFFAASLVMLPTRLLSGWLLLGGFPDIFTAIFQDGYVFELQSSIEVTNPETGQLMPLTWVINPMIYAWGMAVLFGLIMATPLTVRRRLAQMAIGFAVVTLVATWGVFWEAWRDLAFLFGPTVGQVIGEVALTPTLIALCYQLGYLMFPAVIPVASWILMNREFIDREVRRHRQ
jgi:hypothetical protein